MKEKIRIWNQYGFRLDVFDKYREAARRSNEDSVRVFSVLAIVCAVSISVFGIITKQSLFGAVFCVRNGRV